MKKVFDVPFIILPVALFPLSKLSKTSRLVFDALMAVVDEDQVIAFSEAEFRNISKLIRLISLREIGKPTIRNCITELHKSRLLLKIRPRTYAINPLLCLRLDLHEQQGELLFRFYELGAYNPDLREIQGMIDNNCFDRYSNQYLSYVHSKLPSHFNLKDISGDS